MKNRIQSLFAILLIGLSSTVSAQVPVLNSNPSASAVLFLDFDGHTVTGTSWNWNGPIICGGSGMNPTQISETFNRVAEDYRPFNLNVTTDSARFHAAQPNRRMRVIMTVTSSWYGSAGGVAFIGSFAWGDDTPCFVFTALHNYNIKNISEATAHEAGHTFGLHHQSKYDANCNKLSDYHEGVGSGEIGWAPIMGVGYYRNFTVWNNGANSLGCNSIQSDLDVITSAANGFGYRTDDHGSDFSSATLPTITNNQFTATGIIERNTDQDMFRFIMPSTGRFQLNAIPYSVGNNNAGSDLDLQVTLYDASQQAVSVYNPGQLLSSVADTILNAGTYYLEVEGKGNLYAPAYASLGSYSLQATVDNSTAVLPVHKLELRGSQNGDKHQLSWVIVADEEVEQQILEVSTDGRRFTTLTEAAKDDRSYIYRPGSVVPDAQYRVLVAFNDGRRYYSNVVSIRQNEAGPRPRLVTTVTNNGNIAISSPGAFEYRIADYSGRTIRQGKLVSGINNVTLPPVAAGMYLVTFTGKGEQWTDKLLKQ